MGTEIINNSGKNNYVSGNKVFILDNILKETCAELIGNLSNMVDRLPWDAPYDTSLGVGATIKNPYNLPNTAPAVVDVYINSSGGDVDATKSILGLLNIARAKGAIIRTTVLGRAASCASHIAVQGAPNFRIMYAQSYHMIHYGKTSLSFDKLGEIDKANKYEKTHTQILFEPYLKYTDLTRKELNDLQKTEFGHKFADECLKKKLCDWILTIDGKFIHR